MRDEKLWLENTVRRVEKWYRKEDPWGYQTNPEDIKRKNVILGALRNLGIHFGTVLDYGCGEGWITKDLPAGKIYGYDISERALGRLPDNVVPLRKLTGEKYDLVVATDVLCKQNAYKTVMEDVIKLARHFILTCNIRNWEYNTLLNPVYEFEFPYREYTEHLAIYSVNVYLGHHICRTEEKKMNRNYCPRERLERKYVKFLTFDEVYQSVWENRDLLEDRKVILFVAGSYVGKDNKDFSRREEVERICSWEQINDLRQAGAEVGWHTWSHPNLKRVSDERLRQELKCPFKTDYFAYPYGKWNSRVVQAVKDAGFKYAFSVGKGNNTRYQLKRVYL